MIRPDVRGLVLLQINPLEKFPFSLILILTSGLGIALKCFKILVAVGLQLILVSKTN